MNILGIIGSSGGSSLLPETLAFVTRVQAAGSDITGAKLLAYNQLFTDLNTANLRTRIGRLNLFASDNFTGILIPAINTFDGVNVRGNNADTNHNWVSGDWSLTTGLGDAANSTKYLSMSYIADSHPETSQNNFSAGVITNDITQHLSVEVGTYNGSVYRILLTSYDQNGQYAHINDLSAMTNTAGAGVNAISRTGANTRILYNTLYNKTDAVASVGTSNLQDFVFVLNNNSSTAYFSKRKLTGYFFGQGLTLAQIQSLDTILTTFNTSIGR